jgi:archaellum component FlaG (FlaF/FlaG flagellin family)
MLKTILFIIVGIVLFCVALFLITFIIGIIAPDKLDKIREKLQKCQDNMLDAINSEVDEINDLRNENKNDES